MAILDGRGFVASVSPSMCALSGYAADQLVGKPFNCTFISKGVSGSFAKILLAIEQEGFWQSEVHHRNKKGKKYCTHAHIFPLKCTSTAEPRFVLIESLIDEQDSGIQVINERLHSVFNALADMVSVTDKDGNRIFANSKFCDFFGVASDEFKKIKHLFKSATEEKSYRNRLLQLTTEHPSISTTHFVQDKDGNGKWIQWSETGIFDNDGKLKEILSIGRDITEIKVNEDSLHFSLKEVELIGSITQIALSKNPKSTIYKSILEAYHNVTDSVVARVFSYSKAENQFCLEGELKDGAYVEKGRADYLVPAIDIDINLAENVNENILVFPSIKDLIPALDIEKQHMIKSYLTEIESTTPGCALILIPLLSGNDILGMISLVTKMTNDAVISRLRRINEQSSIIFGKLAAVEEMEKQKVFHDTILNKLPVDIAVFNSELQYLFVNEVAIKNPELRKWLIGKTDFEFCEHKNFPRAIAEKRLQHLTKGLSGLSTEYVEEIKTKNDIHFFLRIIHPIVENDKVKYLIGYGVDITGLKKAELAKTEYVKQLEKIAFSTSHEIRQPIVNLQGLVNLLEIEEDGEEKQKLLNYIKDAVNTMDVYTRDLAKELHSYRSRI